MANRRNKLLVTLSALGIAAGVNTAEASTTETYASFEEFFSYASAAFDDDVSVKVDFIRAFPESPAARRMAKQVAVEMRAMSPADRRAAMDEIAATGGLPESVARVAAISGLPSAAVGRTRSARADGLPGGTSSIY